MLGDHRLIVDVRHERAGTDEDIVAVALTEIFQIVQQIAEEKTGVLFVEAEHRAGQNVKTALLAGEVPRLACADVVHDAAVDALGPLRKGVGKTVGMLLGGRHQLHFQQIADLVVEA